MLVIATHYNAHYSSGVDMRLDLQIGIIVAFISIPTPASAGIKITVESNLFKGPTNRIELKNPKFLCDFRDAMVVNSAGKLVRTEPRVFGWKWDPTGSFIFDAANGDLTTSRSSEKWRVLQPASNFEDLIAHEPDTDPLFNQLRITTYTDPMIFWMLDGTNTYSGVCRLFE